MTEQQQIHNLKKAARVYGWEYFTRHADDLMKMPEDARTSTEWAEDERVRRQRMAEAFSRDQAELGHDDNQPMSHVVDGAGLRHGVRKDGRLCELVEAFKKLKPQRGFPA